jgi:hypothetical protein
MFSGTRFVCVVALACLCLPLAACNSTGVAYNPPGGSAGGGAGGSTVQVIAWDFFAKTPFSQGEYTTLPLTSSSSVTEVNGNATNNLNYSFYALADSSQRLWVFSFPSGSPAQTAEIFTNPNATPITLTFTGTSDFGGVAFDKSGNLWAVDYNLLQLYEYTGPFTSSASLTPALTLNLPAPLADPSGLAVDSSGNVYVTNFGDDTNGTDAVAVFTAPVTSSSPIAYWLDGPTRPSALIFDSQGNLYVGSHNWTAGGVNCTSNCITPVVGIAKYASNNLSSGATPNATDNTGMGAVDSNPYAAQFALDSSGNLYMADCGNAGAILEYPSVATQFSATETPSVAYQDANLNSIKCAWGVAVDTVPKSAVASWERRVPQH